MKKILILFCFLATISCNQGDDQIVPDAVDVSEFQLSIEEIRLHSVLLTWSKFAWLK